jgi:serine/threonine protein kinase
MMAEDFHETARSRPGVVPGTRLNGIYEIERLIGIGGMGEVYKGRAIQTGDAVAIKTIRPEMAENQTALALFRKEAAALHNLYHEAIVRYYVFSVDPDLGSPYLAMEFVDGEPLSEVLKRGALGYEAVRILQRRLAGGLQAAHELGIIHRDMSPDNVILPAGNAGRAKIIDFGIARSTLFGDATVIGGGFAGKFGYVSPEQLGLYGGEVTPQSDIYSLGLVLAEAICGRPLEMGGSQVQVIEKRRRVPDLSGIDSRLRPLLERMLQPNPNDRIPTMADVAAWQPETRQVARRRWPLIVGGLAGAAALAGIAIPLVQSLIIPRDAVPPGAQRDDAPPILMPTPGPGTVAELPQSERVPPSPEPPGPPVRQPTASEQPQVSPPVQPPTPPQQTSPQQTSPQQTAHAPQPAATDLPVPPPSPDQSKERLARYVRDYEGGDCFFLTPISLGPGEAAIEGFGSAPAAFQAFDEDFKRANRFEAKISLRLVTDAQCPAVNFMKQIGLNAERAPKLQIEAFNLRANEPLSGTVEGDGSRHFDVVLVADDGYVFNLAEYVKREGATARFSLRLERPGSQRARPQVVMVIASPQPLALLSSGKPIASDALFPLLADEARNRGITLDLAVKYFRLEG